MSARHFRFCVIAASLSEIFCRRFESVFIILLTLELLKCAKVVARRYLFPPRHAVPYLAIALSRRED